jgi:FdhD protein
MSHVALPRPPGPPAPSAVVLPAGSRVTGYRLEKQVTQLPVGHAGMEGEAADFIAVEEPLQIRLAGEPVATLMRTPGDDHLLALGFLYAERILSGADDAAAVVHCGRPDEEGYGNVVDVRPAAGACIDWRRLDGAARIASSACGVCGRATVEELLEGLPVLPPGPSFTPDRIHQAVEGLRRHQPAFDATGGTHAAAALTREGLLLAVHEDVGRHNAVDKVVGALLVAQAAGKPSEATLLAVSGRAGVEIVQKAVRARIPVVASVSAPTSLAVQLARASGLTLLGFVRATRMNIYAGGERLTR